MSDDARREHRRLVVAAVVAGACALAMVALGLWIRGWEYRADEGRFLDPSWWAGSFTSGLGFLAFGKAGFKLGLLAVAGAVGGAAWLRRRRRDRRADTEGSATPDA